MGLRVAVGAKAREGGVSVRTQEGTGRRPWGSRPTGAGDSAENQNAGSRCAFTTRNSKLNVAGGEARQGREHRRSETGVAPRSSPPDRSAVPRYLNGNVVFQRFGHFFFFAFHVQMP